MRSPLRRAECIAALGWLVAACGPSAALGGASGGASSGNEDAMSTSSSSTTTSTTTTTTTGSTTSSTSTNSTNWWTSGDDTTTESSGTTDTGEDRCGPLNCGGKILDCGDGIDNDGDGRVDLEDPECVGPCDNDEQAFQNGIPGDNDDCKQDCYFDGNTGQGDDGCNWDLTCDPENPGAGTYCDYVGGNNCLNAPPSQSEQCLAFCEPMVPNGCDCFGCCEVSGPNGPVWIFLGHDDDCALDNLAGCPSCTPQLDDCGNPCEPELCEMCFGDVAPPRGCDAPYCETGTSCLSQCDCPQGEHCLAGCCFPPPPG